MNIALSEMAVEREVDGLFISRLLKLYKRLGIGNKSAKLLFRKCNLLGSLFINQSEKIFNILQIVWDLKE